MTTPAQFKINVLKSLDYLEQNLPKGSHVFFSGLANGLVLWDSLHNRTHPIGVTYAQVYDFLNCLHISPCWVWMNSNKTVRETGQKRADELSAVYSEIIEEYSSVYKNFDMFYYPFPQKAILKEWLAMGGKGYWELVEPIDGFHPNQISNSLGARYMYNQMLRDHPSVLGPVNPYNKLIQQKFGNQGGYV